MILPTVRNHRTNRVEFRDAFAYKGARASDLTDKDHYRHWCCEQTTDHLFYCPFAGMDPYYRVSTGAKGNIPTEWYAVVADYDKPPEPGAAEGERATVKPTFITRTFSGNVRWIWMLDSPVTVDGMEQAKMCLRMADEWLGIRGAHPGIDLKAIYDPSHLYERGTDWRKIGDPLPEEHVHRIVMESGKECAGAGQYDADLADVYSALAAKYGEKFTGAVARDGFKVGTRCRAFWDDGKNDSACVVNARGIFCFSRVTPFFSWDALIEPGWSIAHRGSRYDRAIGDWYSDGGGFWNLRARCGDMTNRAWERYSTDSFFRYLNGCGFSSEKQKGQTISDAAALVLLVEKDRQVNGASVRLFDTSQKIEEEGRVYLNRYQDKWMRPGPTHSGEWGVGFPWFKDFLDALFNPHEQLEHFIAWWRRFYQNAVHGKQTRGQAVILAGAVNTGKTFLANQLAASVGGMCDASYAALGKSDFNAGMFGYPLWLIDDAQVGTTEAERAKFASWIKTAVAKDRHVANQKYEKVSYTRWQGGRVLVCTNTDVESIAAIPHLNESLADKVHLFKAADSNPTLQGEELQTTTMAKELPIFLAWLLAHEPTVETDLRWGYKSYHNQELVKASEASSHVAYIKDCVQRFRETLDRPWRGTAAKLKDDLNQLQMGVAIRNTMPSTIGKVMGKTEGVRDSGMGREGEARMWIIEPLSAEEREADV